ncbi:MAG: hypothetical protein DWP98_07310 [Bacteroidetes bacterium]|nr:MAG: hypothetical protein DWP98_07310 [Bacteroidota bacterium]MBL1143780.1 hypothetical protein [Bacteroidota bacterium]MCB0802630.1 cellulase family glycosylhydrolase [Flavobacteriales bacterium]NOG56581.1 cellulase family glycosylhydrolase [Bacteroidota bacterium]
MYTFTTIDKFVRVENEAFTLDNNPFFPMILNYSVSVRTINNSIVIGPSREYDHPSEFDAYTKVGVELRLETHFKLIKSMGFNSLRIVGLNDPTYSDDRIGSLQLETHDSLTLIQTTYENKRESYLKALGELIKIAKKEDLKVMLILPRPQKDFVKNTSRINYIKDILMTFSKEPTVFAYDFFNEPLYFDNAEYTEYDLVIRDKLDAYNLVKFWKELMTTYAPNQLFTIGFAEPLEVMEWDPTILPLDFVSFHTYHPLRVASEIYWFSKYVNKPWIISETSLPADNDSISYKSQEIFMKEILQKTKDCGGVGFGWWQYQEVDWRVFEHDFTALVNLEGKTYASNGEFIIGSVKPAGRVIPNFQFQPIGNCNCPDNYYNILGYEKYKITGKVINEKTGEGIEGAVIRSWNQDWSIGLNTFTDENGVFNLYSNQKCVHFNISAPGMSFVSTSKTPQEFHYLKNNDADFTAAIDTTLEYHSIHFQTFLKDKDPEKSTLEFDEKYFSKFRFYTEMEDVLLREVEINPH